MRHRLPVVAAFRARATLHPLADCRLDDVGAIARLARLGIDAIEDVLEHRFLVAEEATGLAVELPQDSGLADREHGFVTADVDEHSLVDFVEIERFTG